MILGMTDGIDDESEPTTPGILVARHQKATLIVAGPPITADDRHDLGHAGMLIGKDCRYDDMVCRMALIERPAVHGPAFTLGQLGAVDRLPFVRPGIADGLFCQRPLVSSEQIGEGPACGARWLRDRCYVELALA